MPPLALGLLIVAAVLHASWNLLVKQAQERLIFTWLSLIAGTLCCLPLLYFVAPIPTRAWPYVIASALAETAYFFALVRAYSQGDFSLVYPLARGAAPALLALWATLFLGERPTLFGLLGIVILIGGLVVVGSGAWRGGRQHQASVGLGAILSALLVALCISVYSAIDGAAVRFAPPVSYTVVIMALTALCATPLIALRAAPGAIWQEWRVNWVRIVAVGVLNLGTYMLVLAAYARARVSYAGAIRELSVVIAALIGWRWLGEPFGTHRFIGAVLIFGGIVVIATLG